ncbi:MOSC domain-containing protein [Caldimonas tepidiphila]|uniref:MOSC domain-containing protein n=1 Tax=Caldimonas tepidiphila TaxID=2315841 RepID=UPI000E5BA4DD|nr:MOSC N-terminal beta barrel domain-containing protein [Caldimonas tepidiphila]
MMDTELALRVAALHLYPVKSCAGLSPDEVRVAETGWEFDRQWMLVDAEGRFVTQRELPRMALVRPALLGGELWLQAPGMPALYVSLRAPGTPTQASVWDDRVRAADLGEPAARWFSELLGRPLRLVRFEPGQRRLSPAKWTGALEAPNAFSDGFPVLVISRASLDGLNERLRERGQAPVEMARFRPNLVIDGLDGALDAHAEDHLDEIAFDTAEGPVRLKLVKPCPRCPIPNIDPQSAEPGHEPLDTLAGYRADARVKGAITFGMNAVIVEGLGRTLRVGDTGRADYHF